MQRKLCVCVCVCVCVCTYITHPTTILQLKLMDWLKYSRLVCKACVNLRYNAHMIFSILSVTVVYHRPNASRRWGGACRCDLLDVCVCSCVCVCGPSVSVCACVSVSVSVCVRDLLPLMCAGPLPPLPERQGTS